MKATSVYLLNPVSLLYLLSRFFHLPIFFTLLVVILHNFPYRHETEMTDRMDGGSATRTDIRNHLCHADAVAEIDPCGQCLSLASSIGVIRPGSNVVSCTSCIATVMMWTLLIALPSLVCALSDNQIPFHKPADNTVMAHSTKAAFSFKEGSNVFTPKDLVELSRPGPGVANVPGDLILVPVSKYSFEDKKCVCVSSASPCVSKYLGLSPPSPPPTRAFGMKARCPCPYVMLCAQQFAWNTGHREEICAGNTFF